MRIWVLEYTPDWEPTTRHGLYASAEAAWEDLFGLVEKDVWGRDADFSVYVGADPHAPDSTDQSRPIVLLVRYQDHEIRLAGESVKGHPRFGYAPSMADWQDLLHVGSLLRQHAVQVTGYRPADTNSEGTNTGLWRFSRED